MLSSYVLQATEKAIWSQANAIKEEALEATRKRLQAEHNRTVKKINRAHEKTLQVSDDGVKDLAEILTPSLCPTKCIKIIYFYKAPKPCNPVLSCRKITRTWLKP